MKTLNPLLAMTSLNAESGIAKFALRKLQNPFPGF
jgi:hypothetical protein